MSISKHGLFHCCMQNVSHLTDMSILCLCALVSSFHFSLVWDGYWTMIGLQTVTRHGFTDLNLEKAKTFHIWKLCNSDYYDLSRTWSVCGQFCHLLNWWHIGQHYKYHRSINFSTLSLPFLHFQLLQFLYVLDFPCAKKRFIRDNGKPGQDLFLLHYVFFFPFWWGRGKFDGSWEDVNQTDAPFENIWSRLLKFA